MQVSIGRLTSVLIALLIAVTLLTTGIGLHILQKNFRTLETQQQAEANDTLRNASTVLRNQVRFYQGIVRLVAANPGLSDLLEFSEVSDIVAWSRDVGSLIPGTLGTALASADGIVYGDPLALRVGAACQDDMRTYAAGSGVLYPLLHTDVHGLEHFDLVSPVHASTGESTGTLFVSFRLSILEELLSGMARAGDQIALLGQDGHSRLVVGAAQPASDATEYRVKVPDTGWELVLYRPQIRADSFVGALVITDAIVLVGAAVVIVMLVRRTLGRLRADMQRVHLALEDVLEGRYEPSDAPTAIKETGMLLPGIEQLALRIQKQRDELRHQSLSDPLTGVFNRRYFDLMLAHLHEQSRRQRPAVLAMVDLNDLKHINDEFGHACGDRALQHAASYLRTHVRATDIVARLGGDEFAVILTNMERERVAEWLSILVGQHAGHAAGELPDEVCRCQFSIGVALIDAEIYPTPTDVYRAADQAMYGVKQRRSIRRSRFAIAESSAISPLSLEQQQR